MKHAIIAAILAATSASAESRWVKAAVQAIRGRDPNKARQIAAGYVYAEIC